MNQVKKRPLLFKAEMVNATLEGRKTQTRRLSGLEYVNSYPGSFVGDGTPFGPCGYKGLMESDYWVKNKKDYKKNAGLYHWFLGIQEREINPIPVKCPYGKVGDRLWVRETWGTSPFTSANIAPRDLEWKENSIVYRADIPENDSRQTHHYWRPSIFMMRWMSRITLEITGVRCERLQDISEDDAIAEGVESPDVERYEPDWKLCPQCGGTRLYDAIGENYGVLPDTDCEKCDTHKNRYRWLWESINGAGSWDANPFVWVIEFKRVEK